MIKIQIHPIWRKHRGLISLLTYLVENNIDVKIVGGCVRDSLLGNKRIADFDIAVKATPSTLKEYLSCKYKVIDIGIKFGSIKVVVNGDTFELTSLRKDIRGSGRYPEKLEYGVCWLDDAKRRDFTINAIYSDLEGNIFDPLGGLKDLTLRRVKFIGCAEERIKEDYLRIMRFFRFVAYLGDTCLCTDALHACAKNREGLRRISGERLTDEFKKILSLGSPQYAISAMKHSGVMNSILEDNAFRILQYMIQNEKLSGINNNVWLYRLAVIIKQDINIDDISFLKLSKSERYEANKIRSLLNKFATREYLVGENIETSLILMCAKAALQYRLLTEGDIENTVLMSERKFPIESRDIINLGYTGKKIGDSMKYLYHVWDEANGNVTKEELLSIAKDIIAKV